VERTSALQGLVSQTTAMGERRLFQTNGVGTPQYTDTKNATGLPPVHHIKVNTNELEIQM
jgi:hypothetical protein